MESLRAILAKKSDLFDLNPDLNQIYSEGKKWCFRERAYFDTELLNTEDNIRNITNDFH
jgi:hypothetical protein